MTTETPDEDQQLSILLGNHDSVLGLGSEALDQLIFSPILKNSRLSWDSVCAVLKRYEIKYCFSPVSLRGFEFPQSKLAICERTLTTHLQWLLVRGAEFPSHFWWNAGFEGGVVLISVLQVLHDYSQGDWPANVPRDVWSEILHGVLLGAEVDERARDDPQETGECACGRAKVCRSKDSALQVHIEKEKSITTSESADESENRQMTEKRRGIFEHALSTATQSQGTLIIESATSRPVPPLSTLDIVLKSDFSPSCLTKSEAAHMCHNCLALIVMASGAARETKALKNSPKLSSQAVAKEAMQTMFSLVLMQPMSALTNALLAVFFSHVSFARRSRAYYARLGVDNSMWLALLKSYVRSGGEITMRELETMKADTARTFVTSLVWEWARRYDRRDSLSHQAAPEQHLCSNSNCCRLIDGSAVDPSGTGFCAVVKCGGTASTTAVLAILQEKALESSSKAETDLFHRAAAGVARWRLCQETGMGWGSGVGPGTILDGEAGELEIDTDSVVMKLCNGNTSIDFANNTFVEADGKALLRLVLRSLKELCGVE